MSAVLRDASAAAPGPVLRSLDARALGAVLAIENACYEFPWTRGNFIDSLAAGYVLRGLCDGPRLLGYFVAMGGPGELHLLNLSVAPEEQHRGHGRRLLDALVALCRAHGAARLWLEVRASNVRAQAIYRRYGFAQVGVRKGYYPAAQQRREDALVMSLDVT